MKKSILLILLSLCLYAAEPSWVNSYASASQTAKSEGKPMLLFMNKPDCGACEFMKENVFSDPGVIAYLNENYISVSLDIHTNDAPKALQVNVTPVFHFLKADGTPAAETLVGGKTAPFFLKLLKQANPNKQ